MVCWHTPNEPDSPTSTTADHRTALQAPEADSRTALYARLSGFLTTPTTQSLMVACAVLAVACGAAADVQRALVASLSDDDSDDLSGAVAALHGCVDAAHSVLRELAIAPGHVLRQLVAS